MYNMGRASLGGAPAASQEPSLKMPSMVGPGSAAPSAGSVQEPGDSDAAPSHEVYTPGTG